MVSVFNQFLSEIKDFCLEFYLIVHICCSGRLDKKLRSDSIFGSTYLVLRVVLHTWLVYGVFFQLNNDDRLSVIR